MWPRSLAAFPMRAEGHVILVGLPGAGKSVVGRRVARRLGWPFLDFDTELERREGMSVERIFARHGEEYFRSRELALTGELIGRPPMVLAPGGGWIAVPGAVDLLRPPGVLVYLATSPALALRRTARSRRVRPLLRTPDPLVSMGRLLAERAPAFARADVELDTEALDVAQLTDKVVRLAAPVEGV